MKIIVNDFGFCVMDKHGEILFVGFSWMQAEQYIGDIGGDH